jgi:hypothetical protein
LQEVLHGGLRPIAVPAPTLPAPDRDGAGKVTPLLPAARKPAADATPTRLPAAPVLSPATPGPASSVVHGIAVTPVQA